MLIGVRFVGRKATVTVKAMNRMAALAGVHMSEAAQLKEDVDAMKLESEKEDFEVSICFPPLLLLAAVGLVIFTHLLVFPPKSPHT